MGISILQDCPCCDSEARANWKEIYARETQPDESVHTIPMQRYSVFCSSMDCYVNVSIVYGHRSAIVERATIAAWNSLTPDYIEQK